jgi:hypothetical protein
MSENDLIRVKVNCNWYKPTEKFNNIELLPKRGWKKYLVERIFAKYISKEFGFIGFYAKELYPEGDELIKVKKLFPNCNDINHAIRNHIYRLCDDGFLKKSKGIHTDLRSLANRPKFYKKRTKGFKRPRSGCRNLSKRQREEMTLKEKKIKLDMQYEYEEQKDIMEFEILKEKLRAKGRLPKRINKALIL